MARGNRKEQILQALALMLETQPGERITTAALAREVGVSEAALYRHFPSKTKMLEGLIEFIEDSLFSRANRIAELEESIESRCGALLTLVLTFAERNPGFARLLAGDALQGETERLRVRMRQVFNRMETLLRQMLRDWAITQVPSPQLSYQATANLLIAIADGRINQFVRSDFKHPPTADWEEQWRMVCAGVFRARNA